MSFNDIIQSLKVTARKWDCSSKGLDQSLLVVHEAVKHYPSWISRGPEYVAPEFKNPAYISKQGLNQTISFEFNGETYVLSWRRHESYFESEEEKRYGSITLTVKDVAVLSIKTMSYLDPDYSPEFLDSVEGYIPGTWEPAILKMRAVVESFENQRRSAENETRREKKKSAEKKDFGL